MRLKSPGDAILERFPDCFGRLVRYGRRLRITKEEAEDLATQSWTYVWQKSGGTSTVLSIEDFERIVFKKMTLLTFDLLGSSERRKRASLDDVPEGAMAEMPEAYGLFLQAYWDEVLKLEPRVRAAILLKMDEDLLVMLHPKGREELPAALPNWSPPPPLDRVSLPASEDLVARKLGVSLENLAAIRSRGKARLRAGVEAWGDEL